MLYHGVCDDEANRSMPTLVLMRHAEAAPAAAGGGDHERALTPAGLAQAEAAGRSLARLGILPTIAVVSTARRAQETYSALAAALPAPVEMRPDRALYDADPETILATLRADAAGAGTAMLIAHNPGVGSLATTLAKGRGKPPIRSFGTATIGIFDFESDEWAPGKASLRQLIVTPVDQAL